MSPLRSSTITAPSSLLRVTPPLYIALVLRFSQVHCLNRSLNINVTGSRVPSQSLSKVHAISMPVADRTIIRHSPISSRNSPSIPVLTTIYGFSTPHQWFTYVRLLDSYLTCDHAFSLTLITMALNHSNSGQFEASS